MIIDDQELIHGYVKETLINEFDGWLMWRLKDIRDSIRGTAITPRDINVVQACETLLDHLNEV
jgi:hypothetical protein